MLRLILSRHAKSDWDDPLVEDFDRTLNARGREGAARIGAWLAEKGYLPDLVLCSAAARTRETWELIAGELPTRPEARFLQELYLAAPQQILSSLHSATGNTVMLIAHNPGCGLAAAALARQPLNTARFQKYPTAATTVLEFDIPDWSKLDWGHGEIIDFTTPRELQP